MVQRAPLLQPHVQPSNTHAHNLLAQTWWTAMTTSSGDSLWGMEGLKPKGSFGASSPVKQQLLLQFAVQ